MCDRFKAAFPASCVKRHSLHISKASIRCAGINERIKRPRMSLAITVKLQQAMHFVEHGPLQRGAQIANCHVRKKPAQFSLAERRSEL